MGRNYSELRGEAGRNKCRFCLPLLQRFLAQHRRSRAVGKAAEANLKAGDGSKSATFDRMKHKIQREEAIGEAHRELAGDDVEAQFAKLERNEEIERLLNDIKSRKSLTA